MDRRVRIMIAAATFWLSAGAASAATVTVTNAFCFDTDSPCSAAQFSTSGTRGFTGSELLGVTASAIKYGGGIDPTSLGARKLQNNSSGLVSDNNESSPQHAFDTENYFEALVLTFDHAVTLTSLDFGWKQNKISFRLFVDGAHIAQKTGGNSQLAFDLSGDAGLTGTTFVIGAAKYQSYGWKHTYWKLDGLTVKHDVHTPDVPLPAGGLLLIGALGGLGLLRRKRAA